MIVRESESNLESVSEVDIKEASINQRADMSNSFMSQNMLISNKIPSTTSITPSVPIKSTHETPDKTDNDSRDRIVLPSY